MATGGTWIAFSACYPVRGVTIVFFRYPILWVLGVEILVLVGLAPLGYHDPGYAGTGLAIALRYLIPPLLGMAVLLAMRAGFQPGTRRSRLQSLAALCLLTPAAAVRAYDANSIHLLLYGEALWPGIFVTLALVFAWGAYGVATRRWGTERIVGGRAVVQFSMYSAFRGSRRKNAASMVMLALVMLAFAWETRDPLVSDLAERQQVEGTVTRLSGGTAREPEYQVWVNQRRFAATRDVFRALRPGERIHAQAGAGSGMIVAIERQPVYQSATEPSRWK